MKKKNNSQFLDFQVQQINDILTEEEKTILRFRYPRGKFPRKNNSKEIFISPIDKEKIKLRRKIIMKLTDLGYPLRAIAKVAEYSYMSVFFYKNEKY